MEGCLVCSEQDPVKAEEEQAFTKGSPPTPAVRGSPAVQREEEEVCTLGWHQGLLLTRQGRQAREEVMSLEVL